MIRMRDNVALKVGTMQSSELSLSKTQIGSLDGY